MQLDKLQLNLRPRSNQQALDLGFSLLRLDVWNVYMCWLALWLPWSALTLTCAYFFPDYTLLFYFLMWWPLPMLERAPLYVLARLVFGETVSWKTALRAWPAQLKGGMLGMMTIGRLNVARGLYHAVWQLENARGKEARARKQLLGSSNTAGSAFWYGVVCSYLATILMVGILGLISTFMPGISINPFALFIAAIDDPDKASLFPLIANAAYALAMGLIGPIYVACTFTLYLNRRATLEAWDLEIALRQINPRSSKLNLNKIALLLIFILSAGLPPQDSWAQASVKSAANTDPHWDKCSPPKFVQDMREQIPPAKNQEQKQIRAQLQEVVSEPDVRLYQCIEERRFKTDSKKKTKKKVEPPSKMAEGNTLGAVMKIFLIVVLICALAWFFYTFRHAFAGAFQRKSKIASAVEVGGLDIRPESLPDDVSSQVRKLWQAGDRRAALALLYRATLSRLVEQDALHLPVGATEGDCLNAASRACTAQNLSRTRLDIARSCTELWRDAAYGARWPETDKVFEQCAAWHAEFDQAERTPA